MLRRHPLLRDKLLALTPQIAKQLAMLIPEAAPIIVPLVNHLTSAAEKALSVPAERDISFRYRTHKPRITDEEESKEERQQVLS